jgi:hypothetical protein
MIGAGLGQRRRAGLLACSRVSATDPRSSTLGALQRAFEKAGVVFLEPGDIRDGGAGVRLKKCAVASAESS